MPIHNLLTAPVSRVGDGKICSRIQYFTIHITVYIYIYIYIYMIYIDIYIYT